MNLTGRAPCPKVGKPEKDAKYLDRVRLEPCSACGQHGPSEAHHCRDKPDFEHREIYDSIPGAAMKSSDYDAIPLCQYCHWLFHNRRFEFHGMYGKDYLILQSVKARLFSETVGF